MASLSSFSKTLRTNSTPSCPRHVRPQSVGRPMKERSAPSANLKTPVPPVTPLSSIEIPEYDGQRASTISGSASNDDGHVSG